MRIVLCEATRAQSSTITVDSEFPEPIRRTQRPSRTRLEEKRAKLERPLIWNVFDLKCYIKRCRCRKQFFSWLNKEERRYFREKGVITVGVPILLD